MHITSNPETLNSLLDTLRDQFHDEPYTEGNMEKMQDTVEHAIVSYSEADIKGKAFLNLHIKETTEQKHLQLFIEDVIFVDIPFRTSKPTAQFLKLETIQDLRVLQTDSL